METVITFVLICAGLLLLYKYLNGNKEREYLSIPALRSYPFIGSMLELQPANLRGQFSELAEQYGDIFQFHLFGTTNIVLNSVEMINKAFCVDEFKQVFNDRPQLYMGNLVNGRNNITLRNCDKAHGHFRKCLTKAMHIYGDGIPTFENVMRVEIHRVMEYIEKCEGKEFEVVALAGRSLSNVMTVLLIGEQATDDDAKCYIEFNDGQDFFLSPMLNLLLLRLPFLRFAPFLKPTYDKIMHSYRMIIDKLFTKMKINEIFKCHYKMIAKQMDVHLIATWTPGKYRGIVDWYFEEQQKEKDTGNEQMMTDDVIKAMFIDILVAGIITTSCVLPSAILCLLNHPEYQQKIQEELDRCIGTDREPIISDRNDCHFLQAVIIETLRLAPPAQILLPHICSKDTVFEGHLIQENTQLLSNIWHIQHDEKIWRAPWVFRPERFLDEHGHLLPVTDIRMKSWLPFGIGRRKCPGVNLAMSRIFLYLSFLLQKWSFEAPKGKAVSCDHRKDGFDQKSLLKPKPFFCVARKRN